jgi:hypothetical protein
MQMRPKCRLISVGIRDTRLRRRAAVCIYPPIHHACHISPDQRISAVGSRQHGNAHITEFPHDEGLVYGDRQQQLKGPPDRCYRPRYSVKFLLLSVFVFAAACIWSVYVGATSPDPNRARFGWTMATLWGIAATLNAVGLIRARRKSKKDSRE